MSKKEAFYRIVCKLANVEKTDEEVAAAIKGKTFGGVIETCLDLIDDEAESTSTDNNSTDNTSTDNNSTDNPSTDGPN